MKKIKHTISDKTIKKVRHKPKTEKLYLQTKSFVVFQKAQLSLFLYSESHWTMFIDKSAIQTITAAIC